MPHASTRLALHSCAPRTSRQGLATHESAARGVHRLQHGSRGALAAGQRLAAGQQQRQLAHRRRSGARKLSVQLPAVGRGHERLQVAAQQCVQPGHRGGEALLEQQPLCVEALCDDRKGWRGRAGVVVVVVVGGAISRGPALRSRYAHGWQRPPWACTPPTGDADGAARRCWASMALCDREPTPRRAPLTHVCPAAGPPRQSACSAAPAARA